LSWLIQSAAFSLAMISAGSAWKRLSGCCNALVTLVRERVAPDHAGIKFIDRGKSGGPGRDA
jgi:hypothetical protein